MAKPLSSLEKHLLAAMVRDHGHALIKREIDMLSNVPRKRGRPKLPFQNLDRVSLAQTILWLASLNRALYDALVLSCPRGLYSTL